MKFYELGTAEDTKILLSRLETEHYSHLKEFNIRFAVIMVTNEDKDGGVMPAFKPLPYRVKFNDIKDRLMKKVDIEVHVDTSYWEECGIEEKEAVFDGALEHLEVVYKKEMPVYNDDGVIKLKKKHPDMNYCGFSVIADRYGVRSPEIKAWVELKDEFREVLN